MVKKIMFSVLLVMGLYQFAVAQNQQVSGTITEAETGMPLPGVTVVEKGTSNGTSTDFDGVYTLSVSDNATLVFSMVGYETREVSVTSGELNLELATDTEALDEVVVTALGIKRSEKALGYALTEVGGDELAEVKQVNAINSLQGKVAGLNVSGAATGPAGTSNVLIRGISSVGGNNQPLYVLDGIPIDNTNLGSAGQYGGSDFGDGISSINPDDIESISVLKGGAAAALYGSRASNGVILINTKSGRGQQGFGVQYSGSVLFETVMDDIYDFQKQYGQGINGVAPETSQEALTAGMQAWGGRLDGSDVVQFDGVERPYTNQGNNLDRFYETAHTITNTVAITKAGEGYNLRFSATDMSNEDVTPNSGMNRKSFSLNGGLLLAEKLTLDVSGKYILEDVKNRPRLSDSPGNASFTTVLSPANINIEDYKPWINDDLTENRISSSTYHQNPYWSAYEFSNNSLKNRFIGSSTIRFDITDWMYALGRAGLDQYTARITTVEPFGTAYNPLGAMTENTYISKVVDADVMLGFSKSFGDFNSEIILGANSNDRKFETTTLNGREFVIPGLVDINNVTNKNYDYIYSQNKINSLYFTAEFSYNDYLFLNVTGRKDWFSTLSLAGKSSSNSYFYPSFNSSFVFSDALDMPEFITFGKLRAGYSDIGGGAQDPYQLSLVYGIFDTYNGKGSSVPLGRITNDRLPNQELKPFSKQEYELGLNLKMFNSRIGVDFAYYFNKTTDDIVPISLSNSSGYSSAFVNIGELTNKGVELLLTGSPIKNENFTWNVSYNLGYNKNEVVKTDDDDNPLFPDSAQATNVSSGAIVGEPFGAIYGTSYIRDDQGRIQYDSNGTPTTGPRKILGNGVAPWTMGLTNNFRYKNWNLSFLIDAKFGADIYSGTSAFANYYGASKNTLVGREDGIAVQGFDASGADFSTTIAPGNVDSYYKKLYEIAEEHIQSADFIKFREFSLGYSLPSDLIKDTFINSANISVIGRNLFFIKRETENIDPESSFNSRGARGLERFGLPTSRSYGLNLNVKF
ncbi:SusC/RagA family TonB-linked outer membrane protein [Zunongwangia endophytica]|uniref:SusC/RagA family TonB-linked outer membrane protein n=1 Tax=Zunongwangia endophytica TaxID=1808945 RepID=A0ABV8H4W1_9FLAO|nr:SusC/RagA family TonB-linked outer membrane protein [Zunongwangia endophytica]MDN3595427.1 SusC/RagA family TonB-linked outer membrane protein [Zunongwangia endophytica]